MVLELGISYGCIKEFFDSPWSLQTLFCDVNKFKTNTICKTKLSSSLKFPPNQLQWDSVIKNSSGRPFLFLITGVCNNRVNLCIKWPICSKNLFVITEFHCTIFNIKFVKVFEIAILVFSSLTFIGIIICKFIVWQ